MSKNVRVSEKSFLEWFTSSDELIKHQLMDYFFVNL